MEDTIADLLSMPVKRCLKDPKNQPFPATSFKFVKPPCHTLFSCSKMPENRGSYSTKGCLTKNWSLNFREG
jgi:hypothetical protein